MNRPRLTVRLAAADVPQAEALLTLAGAETISLRDAADDPVFEPEPNTAPLWPNVTLEALFAPDARLEPLQDVLAASVRCSEMALDTLEQSAWQPHLQRSVKARPVGRRLWLAPADDGAGAPSGRVTVRLNMGLAFGTGEHATTALCLDWLEGNAVDGMTMLDYGCGSGILALAALALGAVRAYAVDNDPQALAATRANAALNGAEGRLIVCAPERLPAVAVDVLAANILAGPLVELAPTFAQRVAPQGSVVLSGILGRQAAHVAAAYAPHFDELAQTERDGWVRLVGRRKGS